MVERAVLLHDEDDVLQYAGTAAWNAVRRPGGDAGDDDRQRRKRGESEDANEVLHRSLLLGVRPRSSGGRSSVMGWVERMTGSRGGCTKSKSRARSPYPLASSR